jgi:branched-chain amino acid transport system ATP-binding protein
VNILETSGLTKYFGGVAALQDVSFEIPEKLICGLIGPNGAGKTTLFNVIAGALEPSKGKVTFRGQDITAVKASRLVHIGIARTHQIVRPFRGMTALENVELGVHFGRKNVSGSGAARKQAKEELSKVGLADKADLPASALSLGEQKRLEVARALATGPDLLLCDEVCGGLSSAEANDILELFRRVRAEGTTILYVEHDMRAVMSVCDVITVLNFGQKLAEGKPEEIRNNPAVIEAYLGKPSSAAKAGHA